jgi:hypothetical protein
MTDNPRDRLTWQACPHIVYTSDDEDQPEWQWLQVTCPDCGCIGVNVNDGIVADKAWGIPSFDNTRLEP